MRVVECFLGLYDNGKEKRPDVGKEKAEMWVKIKYVKRFVKLMSFFVFLFFKFQQ